MFFYAIMSLALPLVLIIVVFGGIMRAVHRRSRKREIPWQYQIAWSLDDFLRQVFFVLGAALLSVALFALNRELGRPLEGVTIVFWGGIVGLAIGVGTRAFYLVIASIGAVLAWWFLKGTLWIGAISGQGSSLIAAAGLFATLFLAVGRMLFAKEGLQRIALFFRIAGAVGAVSLIFFFSTKWGLHVFEGLTRGTSIFASWQLVTSLFLIGIGTVVAIAYGILLRQLALFEGLVILLLGFLFGIIALVPQQYLFLQGEQMYWASTQVLSGVGIFWAVLFNILFVLLSAGTVFAGYIRQEKWVVNIGVGLLALFIVFKYFDFFDFRDKSLFFISAGVLFLVLGFVLERSRRALIARISEPGALSGKQKI